MILRRTLLALWMFVCIGGCPQLNQDIPGRKAPVYADIHPLIRPYYNEYVKLAKENGINFTHSVTMGFTNINMGSVIGICHYGNNFREIDIDGSYWTRSPMQSVRTLVFHELTHCLCKRDHDYGKDKMYPFIVIEAIYKIVLSPFIPKRDGMFDDGCPISIMYPYNVDFSCAVKYEAHYTKEMFDRCEPY